MDDWEHFSATELGAFSQHELQETTTAKGEKIAYRGDKLAYVKDYLVNNEIGYGTFGVTYLALKSGREYVVKEIETPIAENEFKALKELGYDCSRFVNCPVDFIKGPLTSYVISEYIPGTDLIKFCQKSEENYEIDRRFRRTFLSQMLQALNYIHEKQVYHRNITPKNIVYVQASNRFFLVDFSFACVAQKRFWGLGTPKPSCPKGRCIGTPLFVPNSYLLEHLCGMHSSDEDMIALMRRNDTFAIGVIGFLLAEGRYPWNAVAHGDTLIYDDREAVITQKTPEGEYDVLVNLLGSNWRAMTIYESGYNYFAQPEERLLQEPPKNNYFVYFKSLDIIPGI